MKHLSEHYSQANCRAPFGDSLPADLAIMLLKTAKRSLHLFNDDWPDIVPAALQKDTPDPAKRPEGMNTVEGK